MNVRPYSPDEISMYSENEVNDLVRDINRILSEVKGCDAVEPRGDIVVPNSETIVYSLRETKERFKQSGWSDCRFSYEIPIPQAKEIKAKCKSFTVTFKLQRPGFPPLR